MGTRCNAFKRLNAPQGLSLAVLFRIQSKRLCPPGSRRPGLVNKLSCSCTHARSSLHMPLGIRCTCVERDGVELEAGS